MDLEIESIEKNDTWSLVNLPQRVKKVGVKWIYKTKCNEKVELEKYNEVFAPVTRWDTIRTILAPATCKKWHVYHFDIKMAFLHGELMEDVYVDQPLGYKKGGRDKVYKLRKALYGLRKASRVWYCKIEAYFNQENFEKWPHENTLFVKHSKDKILIVNLYVDDLIYI